MFITPPEKYPRIDEILRQVRAYEEVSLEDTRLKAREYAGIYDLLELWTEESDPKEKDQLMREIREVCRDAE